MATIFPANPTIGQIYQGYKWDGVAWKTISMNTAVNYVTSTQLTDHASDTTNIHGIADTSALATKTYADSAASTAAAALVDAAPSALNTLNELAAALNDDANFYTTITNLINAKAPITSPTFQTSVIVNGSIDATSYLQNGVALPVSAAPASPFLFFGI